MRIDRDLLDSLTGKAKASPRLRASYDLRNSAEDRSQRMLNAIEPGSPVPVHHHRNTSETVVVLRGRLREIFYDGLKHSTCEIVDLKAGGSVAALNIPAGQWHSVEAMESGTVILAMKDGAYDPIQDCDILK